MLDQWEEFTAGPSKAKGERMHVSLNSKGQFLLNKNVMNALGNPTSVTLFFSKRTSKIGIRPANIVVPKAFPLRKRSFHHSRMIMASPFCRHHGIRVTGTIAFNQIEIDNEGMLVLDLANILRVSRVAAD